MAQVDIVHGVVLIGDNSTGEDCKRTSLIIQINLPPGQHPL